MDTNPSKVGKESLEAALCGAAWGPGARSGHPGPGVTAALPAAAVVGHARKTLVHQDISGLKALILRADYKDRNGYAEHHTGTMG
jgi:hypothetical protein